MGVNPKVLKPQTLWQMDVLHISEFGRLTYVHVSIDTFPHAVHTTAKTEEIKDVIQHLLAPLKVFFLKKKNPNYKQIMVLPILLNHLKVL